MTSVTVGNFTLNYTLRTNAQDGFDIQFGMDFTVTQSKTPLPLSQLIYPAVGVGNNQPNQWNVDNHKSNDSSVECLVFANADSGKITDKPTEISARGKGVLTTKFSVYRIDTASNSVQINGVTFGYTIDTDADKPVTTFTGMKAINLPNDQKAVMTKKCPKAKFA